VTTIQDWFTATGFEPWALVTPPRETFGVGAARFSGPPVPLEPGRRLFTFVR